MQFSRKLILAAVIFARSAYTGCFKRGDTWNNRNAALDHVGPLCEDICKVPFNVDEERKYPTVSLILILT